MNLIPVTSDNVTAVGYEPTSRTLRVAFRSGGTYDYLGVDPQVFESFLLPHPWRRLGRAVKMHAYRKVA